MKILCKEPKKDISMILKKQKFLFIIKKPNSASAGARHGEFAGSYAGGHSDEQTLIKEKNIILRNTSRGRICIFFICL